MLTHFLSQCKSPSSETDPFGCTIYSETISPLNAHCQSHCFSMLRSAYFLITRKLKGDHNHKTIKILPIHVLKVNSEVSWTGNINLVLNLVKQTIVRIKLLIYDYNTPYSGI